MWLKKLYNRWLARPRSVAQATRLYSRVRRQAPRRRSSRPTLEQLEDRLVPSTLNAATVADLIADINAANLAGGSNTIVLAANTTFDLTAVNNTTDGANGLPVIAKNDSLAITGQGGDIIQRDTAALAFCLLDVAGGASLTLQNLTLQSGLASGSGVSAEGGGIYNQGALVLNGVTVQGNGAAASAGVSSKSGNGTNGGSAAGGGIYSSGTLTLEGGTLVQVNWAAGGRGGDAVGFNNNGGNGGNGSGGGLYVAGGTVNLEGGTLVQGNQAGGGMGGEANLGGLGGNGGNASGGGLYVAGGTVNLTNITLSNNGATGGWQGGGGIPGGGGLGKGPKPGPQPGNGSGGGLYVAGGTVTLNSDTVEYNTAYDTGGGVYIEGNAKVCLDAFTVANVFNNSPDNIYGSYTIC